MRVLSLNVWGLGFGLARDGDLRMRAIGSALAELEPDIVSCQEVWDEGLRASLLQAAAPAGLDHIWHHPEGMTGSGLLTLSRWPIRSAALHRFAMRGVGERIFEADYLGGKGFTELRIDTPHGELAFFGTHLQAAYAEPERDPYIGLRTGQVVELALRLRELDLPVILAGDMNFRPDSDEYTVLLGLTGMRDVAALLQAEEPTVLADNPYTDGPSERIDYLFQRGGWAATAIRRVLDGKFAEEGRTAAYSDHAGLLVDFDFAPSLRAPTAPEARAVELARARLIEGRDEARARRTSQQALGGAGAALFAATLAASRAPALTRRRMLRIAALALGGVAGGLGSARLATSLALRPAEIGAYDELIARLDRL